MTRPRKRHTEGYTYELVEKPKVSISVGYTLESGKLVQFVVGLYRTKPAPRVLVARFDNTHDFGEMGFLVHMDLVDARGNLHAKVPFATVCLDEAISYAKRYFETHAEVLISQFKQWSQEAGDQVDLR